MGSNSIREASSFRDPSGYLYRKDGVLYRQINHVASFDFQKLTESGLYADLVKDGSLIPHEVVDNTYADDKQLVYQVIKPVQLDFISYPYEWCFSQLKDAALLTLSINKRAIERGMILKDASAYNIQFQNGKPVLIDTLSFAAIRDGEPWVAYRQFCQHFLAPLALMSFTDIRLNQLLRIYIDGIPLDMAASILPFKARANVALLMHIFSHAASQKRYTGKDVKQMGGAPKISKNALLGLIDSLESCVRGLTWKVNGTQWAEYYTDTNYSEQALKDKQDIITRFIDRVKPAKVWDLGSNTGLFSRLASQKGIFTVSADYDNGAVEYNYLSTKKSGEANLLPLVIDLSNPSGGVGWQNNERASFISRGPADLTMGLALIHHLAIGNNLPFEAISSFFAGTAEDVVIEFVPKDDSQVKRLLEGRDDIFPNYNEEAFEAAFGRQFKIVEKARVADSLRTLYLLHRK